MRGPFLRSQSLPTNRKRGDAHERSAVSPAHRVVAHAGHEHALPRDAVVLDDALCGPVARGAARAGRGEDHSLALDQAAQRALAENARPAVVVCACGLGDRLVVVRDVRQRPRQPEVGAELQATVERACAGHGPARGHRAQPCEHGVGDEARLALAQDLAQRGGRTGPRQAPWRTDRVGERQAVLHAPLDGGGQWSRRSAPGLVPECGQGLQQCRRGPGELRHVPRIGRAGDGDSRHEPAAAERCRPATPALIALTPALLPEAACRPLYGTGVRWVPGAAFSSRGAPLRPPSPNRCGERRSIVACDALSPPSQCSPPYCSRRPPRSRRRRSRPCRSAPKPSRSPSTWSDDDATALGYHVWRADCRVCRRTLRAAGRSADVSGLILTANDLPSPTRRRPVRARTATTSKATIPFRRSRIRRP